MILVLFYMFLIMSGKGAMLWFVVQYLDFYCLRHCLKQLVKRHSKNKLGAVVTNKSYSEALVGPFVCESLSCV